MSLIPEKKGEFEISELKSVEMIINKDDVNISRDRYDELIRSEVQMQIIKKMYLSETSSYNYDTIFGYLFGEKGDEANAK